MNRQSMIDELVQIWEEEKGPPGYSGHPDDYYSSYYEAMNDAELQREYTETVG